VDLHGADGSGVSEARARFPPEKSHGGTPPIACNLAA
jgi:hypothetical protein